MGTNPNGMDAFLKELGKREGIDVEHTAEEELPTQQTNQDSIRVMLSKLENRYYLTCFVQGQITEDELPGRLLQGQYIFQKASLADICERVEKGLDDREIPYHSDTPIKPGPDHTHVSYELSPRLNDPRGSLLLQEIVGVMGKVHREYTSGL